MTVEGTADLTPAVLHKIESQTAAGADQTFLQLILAGRKPWSPSAKSPAPKPSAHHEAFPPKNGFHPIIVHFPIALFMTGLFLDFLGLVRGNKSLHLAGWYNLVLAAVSALGALATGFFAIYLLGVPMIGLIRNHMLLGISGTILMWGMAALRVHRHEKISVPLRALYYILAALTCVIIAYAGHLGGSYVYGE